MTDNVLEPDKNQPKPVEKPKESSELPEQGLTEEGIGRRNFAKTAGIAAAATLLGATTASAGEVKSRILQKLQKEVSDAKESPLTFQKMGGTYGKLAPPA